MPRRAAKVDLNQKEIVKHFRSLGATVAHTHMIGQGYPDITVGYRGTNYMVEIKTDESSTLTKDEKVFHDAWRGTIHIIRSKIDSEEMLFG